MIAIAVRVGVVIPSILLWL